MSVIHIRNLVFMYIDAFTNIAHTLITVHTAIHSNTVHTAKSFISLKKSYLYIPISLRITENLSSVSHQFVYIMLGQYLIISSTCLPHSGIIENHRESLLSMASVCLYYAWSVLNNILHMSSTFVHVYLFIQCPSTMSFSTAASTKS